MPSICFNLSSLLERFRDSLAPTWFPVWFSKTLSKGEYANLAASITCLLLKGNISSPVRYSYLPIFPDDNAEIFASLLISYYNVSSLIL